MQGVVVDKQGNPIPFRVLDPSTGETTMALLQVRGGMLSMINVPPSQLFPVGGAQPQPDTNRRRIPGEAAVAGTEVVPA